MKKYILGLSIAAFTISLSGCADFLEEPVRAQQNLDDYFKSEDTLFPYTTLFRSRKSVV